MEYSAVALLWKDAFLVLLMVTAREIQLQGKVSYSFETISVALVRERTIPTERPPLVGEVSAYFCG
jgi:hypothetical protein